MLMYMFELISELKINFMKSDFFTINADDNVVEFYSELFNCQLGQLPMRYIGMHVTFANLKNVDWDFLDARMLNKLDSWIGDSATSGGRLVLLDSSLSGIPYFYIS